MTNKDKLRQLLSEEGITQSQAADRIAAYTKRPCSVRSIRSWLANDDLSSSRPCPDWALAVLQDAAASRKTTADQIDARGN